MIKLKRNSLNYKGVCADFSSLPQRGRGTTAVVDEETEVCTAEKTSVPKLLCRLQIIDA